ncbi:MAG: hypothetical protein Q9209_001534 [Squamulea sp. 1 TL-2023]
MQFFNIAFLLPLVLSSAIANPVREEELPGQLAVADEAAAGNELAKRGFGCPNDVICSNHCRSLKGGRTGGYCKWQM